MSDYNAAYHAGYNSYFAGGTYAHCPYDISDPNSSYWVQGFDVAREETEEGFSE